MEMARKKNEEKCEVYILPIKFIFYFLYTWNDIYNVILYSLERERERVAVFFIDPAEQHHFFLLKHMKWLFYWFSGRMEIKSLYF